MYLKLFNMNVEINKETAELLIDAINSSHLPTKRSLRFFINILKTIENENV